MNEVLSSGARTEDEGLYPIQHGYWHELMQKALGQTLQEKETSDDSASAEATRAAAQLREESKAAAKAAAPEPRRRRRTRG